jgi:hypothetical protein
MSTNCQHSPISSRGSDLNLGDKQFYSSSVAFLSEDKLQQGLVDDHKPHKENDYQAFTNATTGGVLQIPNWPGPQTLEKTHTDRILTNLGYMLCLVPPLFFLGKEFICTS